MSKVSDVKDILILGGVGLAAYTVYKNKDQIGGFFGGIGAGFNDFTDNLGKFGNDLSNNIANLGNILANQGQQAINVTVQMAETIKEKGEEIITEIPDNTQLKDTINNPGGALLENLGPASTVITTASDAITTIAEDGLLEGGGKNLVDYSSPASLIVKEVTGKTLSQYIQEAMPSVTSTLGSIGSSAISSVGSTLSTLVKKLQTTTNTKTSEVVSGKAQVKTTVLNQIGSFLSDITGIKF